ncbi:MAG TPA: hypothetical protein VHC69_11930 [Polyangiaceae bacterium]|nr:hypothetical protein [Polyangiaceae bacterium]
MIDRKARSNGISKVRSACITGGLAVALCVAACSKDKSSDNAQSASAAAESRTEGSASSASAAGEHQPAPNAPQPETEGQPDAFCALPFQEGAAPAGFKGVTASPSRAQKCAACEARPNKCPRDATGCDKGACSVQPACDDYPTAAQKTACQNVRRCVRQSNCLANGVTSCYCGDTDLNGCTANLAGAVGPCKEVIVAGFASGTTSAQLLARLTDVSQPAGGAMALAQCDHDVCAADCIPYCQ